MFDNEGGHGGAGRGRHRAPRDFDRGPGGWGHGSGSFGPGRMFPFGLAAMFGRGPAVRRGDVRSALLALLAEQPMHGYQIIQELTERSGGAWRPSAGSVYPTLQQLEDEGLVRGEERDGRRVFTLTEEGKVAAARATEAGPPWETDGRSPRAELGSVMMQVARAAMQVRQVGSPATITEARRILVRTRRDLYRLLAEDEGGDFDAADAPSADTSTAAEGKTGAAGTNAAATDAAATDGGTTDS